MLDNMYSIVTSWAIANRFQILKNRVVGRMANYIYPFYCKTYPLKPQIRINDNADCSNVIVSLTSFPDRIEKVYLCINSILRQTKPADRVILWLADEQFPLEQGNRKGIPEKLIDLTNCGLEIRFCEDLRSYKKVFFTAQQFTKDIIITADDDTLYPEYWIEELLETSKCYPECVCCYRAHKMSVRDGRAAPYSEWIGLSPNEKGPLMSLVPIGVGGVLYPANYFSDVNFDSNLIRTLCPTTDDLWLKTLGIKKGYKVVKVMENSKEWFTLKSSQKSNLMSANVGEKVNDHSLAKLFEYYDIDTDQII